MPLKETDFEKYSSFMRVIGRAHTPGREYSSSEAIELAMEFARRYGLRLKIRSKAEVRAWVEETSVSSRNLVDYFELLFPTRQQKDDWDRLTDQFVGLFDADAEDVLRRAAGDREIFARVVSDPGFGVRSGAILVELPEQSFADLADPRIRRGEVTHIDRTSNRASQLWRNSREVVERLTIFVSGIVVGVSLVFVVSAWVTSFIDRAITPLEARIEHLEEKN